MNTIKQHALLFLLALASLSSLSGCSADDLPGSSPDGANSAPASSFQIHVTDCGYASADAKPGTRAEENGYKTVFTAGDKIGVFAVKGRKIVNEVNNLCLTASEDNGRIVWKDSNNNPLVYVLGDNVVYYAYYPYREPLTGDLASDATDAAGFFANVITNWFIDTDQGTYANYTAQDLMIAKGTVSGKELSFSMQHQMALVVIDLPKTKYKLDDKYKWDSNDDAPDTKFTDFSPCRMSDGTYRYLVKPSPGSSLSGSYTNTISKTWQFNPSISASKYKIYKVDGGSNTKIEKNYTLQVGDFYMKDGSLVSKDVSLSKEQQDACIGIVYCTDPKRIGKAAEEALKKNSVTTPHGLVMALTNASSSGCRWGNYGTDENSGGVVGTPFQDNITTLQKQYNNVDGYGETHWILTNRNNGTTLQDTYTAFYHASRYGTKDSGTAKYAAPANTTGWFIPSMGQWWDILSYLGGIDLKDYRADQRKYISISGAALTAVDNMNKYLEKISDATMFSTGTYFWSSSEYSSDYACRVLFLSSGDLDLDNYYKGISYDKVRCVFAF